MRDHVTRRPMPVEQSILWKPLHDSHYVVASLQPADGGRRKIFVRQQVIARVEALVRAGGRRTVGLLLGQFYQCSVTGAEYLVIESIDEQTPASTEDEIAATVAEALARRAEHHIHLLSSAEHRAQVLGWYRGAPSVEPKPSLTVAGVHVSLFNQPWQMTLVVGESANHGGAIFLRDTVNSRWFYAPFYELLSHAVTPNQPKPTLIDWPQYLTADYVVAGGRELVAAHEVEASPKKHYERPWLRRSPKRPKEAPVLPLERPVVDDVPLLQSAADPATVAPPRAGTPAAETAALATPQESLEPPPVADVPVVSDAPIADRPAADRAADRPLADRPAPRAVHGGLADMPRSQRERPISRRLGRSEKLSIVDDRDQRTAAASSGRRIGDDEDTTIGDDPGRYIELARVEGFFIAGRFDTSGEMGGPETLWILNEPYSGMLLTVVSAASEVLDATLHYNLQTDDAGLKRTPFPEHRDEESKTIYVRESCADSLRARCRRLRATNALLREWKVTPAISFLTPGEWESIPAADAAIDRGVRLISDLNKARIAELPPGVRTQFHLAGGDEATA